MAENQNENPEKKTVEELKKEAEKIFEQGKKKISDKIDEVKAGYYKDNPSEFETNNVEKEAMVPLRKTYDKKRAEMSAVERGTMETGEKISKLAQLKAELRTEIETGYKNAIALIEKMTDSEMMMTKEALAKISLEAPRLTALAESEKGKPLTEMFSEFMTVTRLSDEHEKILTDAINDPELVQLAFFVLSMGRRSVQEEFTTKFIEKYPEKGTWLLEKGNCYGCYDPVQLRKFLLLLKEKPASQASAERELQDFDKYEKVYASRYNSMQMYKKRVEGLYAKDDSNAALKALTFKGAGRFVGYMSASATILLNLVANRKEYMKNPGLMAKNVYLWGAAAGLTWLYQTGQGKRPGDSLTSQATRESAENKQNLQKFNAYMAENYKWGEFFHNNGEGIGGAELLGHYIAYLGEKGKIAKYTPTVEEFLIFCGQKEEKAKVDKNKRASVKLELMAKENKEETQEKLEDYFRLFEKLKVENQANFIEMANNAKLV